MRIAAPARCAKPVIAANRGYCFGVGFELSLACDFRIVSETCFYALPEQRHFSTLLWLAGGLGCAFGGVVLSAWRWQRVLHVFGQEVRLRTLIGHYFSGQFVGNVLPSTIGGDVLRVTRLTTEIGSGPTAFGSVALERLTGFIALPLICFALLAAFFPAGQG